MGTDSQSDKLTALFKRSEVAWEKWMKWIENF